MSGVLLFAAESINGRPCKYIDNFIKDDVDTSFFRIKLDYKLILIHTGETDCVTSDNTDI